MKAKVIANTTVYNEPRNVGDIVEVDDITFHNLAAKGRLEESKGVKASSKKDDEPEDVDSPVEKDDEPEAVKPPSKKSSKKDEK